MHITSLLKSLLLRLGRDRAGATAVTLAISLSAIIGCAGLGTETASWYFNKRLMQGAADAAAASAASALAAGATGSQLTSDAQSVSASYGYVNGSNSTTVTVNYPPKSGNYQSSPAVEVLISQPQQPLISAMFLSSGPTIAVRAVALAQKSVSGQGCVLALNTAATQGLTASGSSTQLNLTGCSLYINASGSTALSFNGGATINAADAYIVGSINGSGLTTTDGTYTGADALIDPYLTAAVPSYSTSGCVHNYNLNSGSTDTKTAGASGVLVFCDGVQLTGNSTLNLCPGTYIVAGGSFTVGGGSTLNAPPSSGCATTGGVTVVLTTGSNGKCATASFGGGANINMTAPATGALSGIAVFQDRACTDATQNNTLNGGATQNITGAIYFPGEPVSYSGGAPTGGAICTQLIANTVTLSGSSTFNNTCTGTGTRAISYTGGRLVE